ncbi:Transcriptional regulator, TetR family [Alloactinosynnema sp. L-07]|uniref:TetR/AcrR family transcriptional regulator n=1 Tax=Alloactinosynnema sp. L-07 TaxID=1653480 RepID=UPI00065F043D|nr:TetR/AcrR family transcriptional regulator [Alloactinosynnema sp. L-07]CRK59416.1 Transcriptional regulator, TetR family [Alloactinosynnema sp. L-07]
MTKRAYHHGDLRRAVLAAAVEAITEHGTGGVSLRDLARRAGVSHAGPVHHFGDKAGLLTAIAAEGYGLLADALVSAWAASEDFREVGVAYVRFAIGHRAHFEVMFRPDLYHADDSEVVAARERANTELTRGVGTVAGDADPGLAAVAAWSLMHGFATLWITGAMSDVDRDPEGLARSIAGVLFSG